MDKERVVFLDRDGVINTYPGDTNYVCSWKEFRFIPGSIEGIKKLKESGFKIFVISNQACVGKGIISQKRLDGITKRMSKELEKHGAYLDGIYYCVHKEEDNCDCRKPKIGLLKRAIKENNIDCKLAIFIGDSFRDLQAAKEFGAIGILLLSGKEKICFREQWPFEPDYVFDNLLLASNFIVQHYGER